MKGKKSDIRLLINDMKSFLKTSGAKGSQERKGTGVYSTFSVTISDSGTIEFQTRRDYWTSDSGHIRAATRKTFPLIENPKIGPEKTFLVHANIDDLDLLFKIAAMEIEIEKYLASGEGEGEKIPREGKGLEIAAEKLMIATTNRHWFIKDTSTLKSEKKYNS